MKRMLSIFALSVVLLIAGYVLLMRDLEKKDVEVPGVVATTNALEINGRNIIVDVADDARSRSKGLSGRESLDADKGMYFMFSTSSVQYFWMYGMKFPIDMIFIKDDEIVSVSSSVPYPQGMEIPAVVSSGVPANRVLELNAGKAEEWGIKEGMRVGSVSP